jgi:N-methylhydantoinase B/oxoprolinase/acetone carboxylase alpha subunit
MIAQFSKLIEQCGHPSHYPASSGRLDGSIEKLKGCDATMIDAGEALIIQTPTAGGYGKPER